MGLWHPYPEERPERSGTYLIIQDDGNGGKKLLVDVAEYFKKGDLITCLDSDIDGTAEERMLDSIMNRPVYVEKEGFYTGDVDTNQHWEYRVTAWTELPEPPEGYTYL